MYMWLNFGFRLVTTSLYWKRLSIFLKWGTGMLNSSWIPYISNQSNPMLQGAGWYKKELIKFYLILVAI